MNISKEKRQAIANTERILSAINSQKTSEKDKEPKVDLVSLAKELATRREKTSNIDE